MRRVPQRAGGGIRDGRHQGNSVSLSLQNGHPSLDSSYICTHQTHSFALGLPLVISQGGNRARYSQSKVISALAHTLTVSLFGSFHIVRERRELVEHLLLIGHPRSRGRAPAADVLLVAGRGSSEFAVHVGHRFFVAALFFLCTSFELSNILGTEERETRHTATFLKTLSQAVFVPSYDLLTSFAYFISASAALSISDAALASPFNKGSRSCSALLLLLPAGVSARAVERLLAALDSFLPDLAKASVACRCSWRAVRTLSNARSDLCKAGEESTEAEREEGLSEEKLSEAVSKDMLIDELLKSMLDASPEPRGTRREAEGVVVSRLWRKESVLYALRGD